jgi:hypothetical protein
VAASDADLAPPPEAASEFVLPPVADDEFLSADLRSFEEGLPAITTGEPRRAAPAPAEDCLPAPAPAPADGDAPVPAVPLEAPPAEPLEAPPAAAMLHSEDGFTVREPPPSARPSPRRAPRASAAYSDEELARIFAKLLETKKSPDPDCFPALRRWIDREMREAIIGARYDDGLRLRLGGAMLDRFSAADPVAIRAELRRTAAVERLALSRDLLERKRFEWGDRISERRAVHGQRAAELAEAHRARMEEFECAWAGGASSCEFAKPSGRVLNLRRIQENFALLRDFESAKALQKEADNLERLEAERARSLAVAAMKMEYATLVGRQQREIECMHAYRARETGAVERRRDAEIDPLQLVCGRLAVVAAGPPAVRERKNGLAWQEPASATARKPMVKGGQLRRRPESLSIGALHPKQFIKVEKKMKEDERKKKKKKAVAF